MPRRQMNHYYNDFKTVPEDKDNFTFDVLLSDLLLIYCVVNIIIVVALINPC
uniref:Neur_chan_LBD domain-containing protein n=1 Tax=Heterorhabditis bacteriophora TaxID=37862 RepID=A0A1I7WBD1_HETBA